MKTKVCPPIRTFPLLVTTSSGSCPSENFFTATKEFSSEGVFSSHNSLLHACCYCQPKAVCRPLIQLLCVAIAITKSVEFNVHNCHYQKLEMMHFPFYHFTSPSKLCLKNVPHIWFPFLFWITWWKWTNFNIFCAYRIVKKFHIRKL